MALILLMDTSTPVCSVALAENSQMVHHIEVYESFSHASQLTVLIQQLFGNNGVSFDQIDAVAVSCGPGSYTGLRIGTSTAKGLCYALGKPLIAIGSLDVLAWPVVSSIKEGNRLFCPMIDARRMEVYTAMFSSQMDKIMDVSAQVITENSFTDELEQGEVYFFGDGAPKCKQVITHRNAIFIDDQFPLAMNMAEMAYNAYSQQKFEDVAYFEPFYLKDFVATVAKNKIPV
ncbi:MAG: tRNA (adenosine(37)-N6)-threonylcarbamoyltransferase complex dimerization subunit type 1 TsaB [Breznakibacter sp.]